MTTAPNSPSETERLAVASQMLVEARDDLRLADQKAGLLLTARGIGVGALMAALLGSNWDSTDLPGIAQVFWWLGAAATAVSATFTGRAVIPRTSHLDPDGPVTFWGHVAHLESVAELDQRLQVDALSEVNRAVDQLFHVSVIAANKFYHLRCGVIAAAIAASLFIVSAILAL